MTNTEISGGVLWVNIIVSLRLYFMCSGILLLGNILLHCCVCVYMLLVPLTLICK